MHEKWRRMTMTSAITRRAIAGVLCTLVVVSFARFLFAQGATERPKFGIVPPELVAQTSAVYPAEALAERLEGVVSAAVFIDADGKVVNVEVLSGGPEGYGFDAAAIAAIETYVFLPALNDGRPIPSRIQIDLPFSPPTRVPIEPEVIESSILPDEQVPVEESEPEPPALSLQGLILERGTRSPLAGVLVSVEREGELFESYTNDDGRFELRGLTTGEWKVTIEETEFAPFETEEQAADGEVVEATYFLERTYYDAYGTDGASVYETRERKARKEVTRRTLEVSEIQKIPGNSGDALKVVQNLPGVARSTFNSGAVVVRGSAPQDTEVQLDGSPIPLLYHFGGLTSVINSDILSSIDFYPGNFSARYGRAMGGILDVKTRAPRKDRFSGYVDVDIIDISALLEGPITQDLSFQLSARRSYFDTILPLVLPDDAGLDLTVAPRYWDYQGRINWKPAPHHELEAFSYGSDDVLEFLLDEPQPENPIVRGNIEAGTSFHRGQVTYTYRGDRVTNRFSTNFGNTLLEFALGDTARFVLDILQHSTREELTYEVSDRLTLLAGMDILFGSAKVQARLPEMPREGEFAGGFESRRFVTLDVESFFYYPAYFMEAQLQLTQELSMVLGGRLDYDLLTKRFNGDLRSSLRFEVDEHWALKAGVGSFSQPPQPQETIEEFGNPDLQWQTAYHYSLGGELRLPFYEPALIDVTGFYKNMSNLITDTTDVVVREGKAVPEVFSNDGLGEVYGIELLARHELANNFFGWVAYTFSKGLRKDGIGEPWNPFEFDQTHILTVIGSIKLPDQWQVGGRFRYVTGRPYTPRDGSVFDADADDYTPVPGPTMSSRIEAFHQLDLRVDKSWVFDLWILSAYIDVQGVYYHANPEAVQYNYDSTQSTYVRGLPILPSFGIKGEF
ncbi:MAG: hypothetical protein AUK47_01665 [Deltaproteobacteria bacterium CG2_30_63_29]|nr:MAG: hypothetical protein AUK47_01665 [Deltaproteobacteria bacterium CG2_30_63_29]